jgi:FtsP/CotA-like multicopper oxidase with cupredoxin domain
MSQNRRGFLLSASAASMGAIALARAAEAGATLEPSVRYPAPREPGQPDVDYRPVITPNGATLPFKIVDGVKVFHLIAEEVEHEFAEGLKGHCWGYNGRVHGPTIEAVEGDRVRIYVSNRLPAPTTVHWHGALLPSGMDGVGGLSQRSIQPGETFKYEFTLRQHGTLMYHSHHDEMTQMAMGMMGMFVIHPRERPDPPPDREFVYMLSEWKITPGTMRPDPNEMTDFNVVTLNGKVFPSTTPLVAKTGERIRIRFGNLSAMDHHPMHLHGHHFRVVETDGGVIPEAGRWPETTVLVPVGSTRTVEFIANAGDWAMHCHMTHHLMNQMGHGIPNLIGADPSLFDQKIGESLPDYMTMGTTGMTEEQEAGTSMDEPKNSIAMLGGTGPFGYITMGGMFAILKVRDELQGDADPGWYANPEGTVADVATNAELRRDEIEFPTTPRSQSPHGATHEHGGGS